MSVHVSVLIVQYESRSPRKVLSTTLLCRNHKIVHYQMPLALLCPHGVWWSERGPGHMAPVKNADMCLHVVNINTHKRDPALCWISLSRGSQAVGVGMSWE